MVTKNIAYRLLAATILVGSVAVAGSAMAKPAAAGETLASASSVAAAADPVTTTVPAIMEAAASPCGRKVKVVYAGYGEADRAGCASSSKAAAN